MRISDWSSDVCSSDLKDDWRRRCDFHRFRLDIGRGGFVFWLVGPGAAGLRPFGGGRRRLRDFKDLDGLPFRPQKRSEEHTSELQSLMRISYAVFCLKKKKKYTQSRYISDQPDHTTTSIRKTSKLLNLN